MAAVCSLNNRSRILLKDGTYQMQGEPTEAALKVLAEKIGKLHGKYDHSKQPMAHFDSFAQTVNDVAVLDFSSERKCMSTVVTGYEGNSANTVLLKGAPERVIEMCSTVLSASGETSSLSEAQKAGLISEVKKVSSEGYRVLGIAIGLDGGNMKHITKANTSEELTDISGYTKMESNCSFVGYVCIKDPVRPEVKGAIDECRRAGINVIMITGDAKETAVSIA